MSVHTPLAVEIARRFNRRLSSRYIALTARRLVMDTPEESDVVIGTLVRTPIPHIIEQPAWVNEHLRAAGLRR